MLPHRLHRILQQHTCHGVINHYELFLHNFHYAFFPLDTSLQCQLASVSSRAIMEDGGQLDAIR